MTTSQRWTMLATILGMSMVCLDGTVVDLALTAAEGPGAGGG